MKLAIQKVIGTILIVIGALPFLLMIEVVNTWMTANMSWIIPGSIIYQAVIVVIGVVLLIEKRQYYT